MRSEHLEARVDSLLAEASHLERLLGDAQRASAALNSSPELADVVQRLQPVVAKMIDPLKHELRQLRESADTDLSARWRTEEELADRLDKIAAELLPVVEGVLARATAVDRGWCALAQRLLDGLANQTEPWGRVVIPAAREMTSTSTWVVGLPLRDSTFWSLPIVVHELGHFAATRLRDQFDQLLGVGLLEGSWRNQPGLSDEVKRIPGPLPYRPANELFADVFAAYCMGPAYAATLIARAVPADAWLARGDHPSWGSRVRAVLRTTATLEDRFVDLDDVSWSTAWLGKDWATACAAAGTGEPSRIVAEAVDAFTESAIEVMNRTSSRARVHGEGVLALGEQLRRGDAPPGDVDLRMLLNAAWAERLRTIEGKAAVERALSLWRPEQAVSGDRVP